MIVLAVVIAGLWGTFYALGSAKRHRLGRTAIGVLVAVGAIGYLWRHRADVARNLIAGGCVIGVVGMVAAVWMAPGLRWSIILPTIGLGLVIIFLPADLLWEGQPGGILAERFADRRPSAVLADWIEANHVKRQIKGVADKHAPGSAVAKPRRVGPGQWAVPVHMNGDPALLDPHALGGAVNRTGADARSIEVKPGDRLGTGLVLVSDRPAPPPQTLWQQLDRIGAQPWPGPVSTRHDAPVAMGFDVHTRTIHLATPGIGGGNTLVGGTSGSGKSTLVHVSLADLCFRPDVAIILLDPDGVEHGLYRDRATIVAQGPDECVQVIERLPEVMDGRSKDIAAADRRFFRAGKDGPLVIVVCDEYAAIPDRYKDGMTQWLARARKFGGGTIIATQRPERSVIPLIQRDNCQVRIALSLLSAQALDMILGDDAREHASDIIHNPLKGAFVARMVNPANGQPGGFWKGRSYLLTPPVVRDDDPIGTAARMISQRTAHLRIEWKDLLRCA